MSPRSKLRDRIARELRDSDGPLTTAELQYRCAADAADPRTAVNHAVRDLYRWGYVRQTPGRRAKRGIVRWEMNHSTSKG